MTLLATCSKIQVTSKQNEKNAAKGGDLVVTSVNKDVTQAAREICDVIAETLCKFGPGDRERALGILEGMAIMREIQQNRSP